MICKFQVVSDSSHTFHRTADEAFQSALAQLKSNPEAVFTVEKYVSGEWVEYGIVGKKMVHKYL